MAVQNDWRWCHKCEGLFYARGRAFTGRCAAGGAHENVNSGDYSLFYDVPGLGGQNEWRWCQKCEALFYSRGAGSTGVCPAGGAHEGQNSGDYTLFVPLPV